MTDGGTAPGNARGEFVLTARKVSAGYGSQAVIHEIDLEVRPGEVIALLGPNGAGKSTTLLTLAGELTPLAGEVAIDGVPTRSPLYKRARNGLGYVPEERSVFKGLSTRDNLRAARIDPEIALDLFPALRDRIRVRGGLLSGGEQQMLTLARALSRKPKILLADELSLGLAPLIVRQLLETVRRAADEGCGVVVVEQHVRQALRIADRAYVMRRGRIELEGTGPELRDRIEEIEATYL